MGNPLRHIARTIPAALIAGLFGVLVASAPLVAQTDSVTITAGSQYAASGLRRTLFGEDYRDVWAVPIRVPILDFDTFGGGIEPVERGGGMQTISLRFRAPDGREYNFRSVDKDQTGGLHPDFRNTLIDWVAQDQISAKHPAGALIAHPLLEAAGVPHPEPALYVMPDDPRLGEFRELFAGMLGLMEIHPSEGENNEPLFFGAERVTGADRLLERLEESPEHRADAREYLRARLMDFLIGDWDRHLGQWRWARYTRADSVHWWVPVPEDRDNAFVVYDGLLLDLARSRAPKLIEFGDAYPDIFGLTENAEILDRWVLSELPREEFDAMAADLQVRLTDEVIAAAIANSPPEYQALRGREIADALVERRAGLPEIAHDFYALLSGEVDVRATDENDLALVDRHADGSVDVRLYGESALESFDTTSTLGGAPPLPSGDPYFDRRFLPGETDDIRIFMHGGDDLAIVRGDGSGHITVRVIGGGSDDLLIDRAGGGARTAFYDDEGDNEFLIARGTIVDTAEFEEPESGLTGFNENAPGYRDWGSDFSLFQPSVAWRYNIGPVIGGGPRATKWGFRKVPYAHSIAARFLYAPLHTRFGVEIAADFRETNSISYTTVTGYATQVSATRFHGYGNETVDEGSADRYKIFETLIGIEPLYHYGITPEAELFMGPVVRYTRPELHRDGPADLDRPFGSEAFWQLGGQTGGVVDTRDLTSYPRAGVRARVTGSAFSAHGGIGDAFGGIDAVAATYVPLPLPLESTLALRAGGRAAWGDFPIQAAAFVGGPESLRGYPHQRYAGDGALFGGAELRTFLMRFKFISRGDLGLVALADAGRVFVDDEASSHWHTGVGGGVWVGILDRTRTLSAVIVRGEITSLYVALGMPF
jgi:hypothetical protein